MKLREIKITLFLFAFFYSIPLYILSQCDCSIFGEKPVTALDSVVLNNRNVEIIKIFADHTIEPGKSLIRAVDVKNHVSNWCPTILATEKSKSKIIQTAKWADDQSSFYIVHYFSKKGVVTKTEFRSSENVVTQLIKYNYDDQLLESAIYCQGKEDGFKKWLVLSYEYN